MIASAPDSFFGRLGGLYCAATRQIDKLQPLLLLAFRLYVARVFFMSGLTKIHDWSVTVALFTDEYHVPVLPPGIAALMGTATALSFGNHVRHPVNFWAPARMLSLDGRWFSCTIRHFGGRAHHSALFQDRR